MSFLEVTYALLVACHTIHITHSSSHIWNASSTTKLIGLLHFLLISLNMSFNIYLVKICLDIASKQKEEIGYNWKSLLLQIKCFISKVEIETKHWSKQNQKAEKSFRCTFSFISMVSTNGPRRVLFFYLKSCCHPHFWRNLLKLLQTHEPSLLTISKIMKCHD